MTRRMLESLPDEARLWLWVLDRPLEGSSLSIFESGMDAALAGWRHKGVTYDGAWTLRDGQLLLVAEPTMASQPSGCAISALTARVVRCVEEAGAALVPDGPVVACTCSGLRVFERHGIEGALAEGHLDRWTPILDRTLFSLGDLRRRGLTQSLETTWIGRKFGLQTVVGEALR